MFDEKFICDCKREYDTTEEVKACIERGHKDAIEQWTPRPCRCGHPACKDWHIDPVASVQCVKFTKEQAEAICKAHNEGLLP